MNYITSSLKSKEVKIGKEYLIQSGYRLDDVKSFVCKYMDIQAYKESLQNKDNLFLVMPSTSGKNIIPLYMSAILQKEYGGTISVDYALPMHKTKSAYLGAVSKIKEPREYLIRPESFRNINMSEKNVILVDDVVTSGTSVYSLQNALEKAGVVINYTVSIAQSDKRLVSERDMQRLSEKLVPVNGDLNSVKKDVELIFSGKLKHLTNTIEREVTGPAKIKYKDFVYEYITKEASRIRTYAAMDRRLQSGEKRDASIYTRGNDTSSGMAVEEGQRAFISNPGKVEGVADLLRKARKLGYSVGPDGRAALAEYVTSGNVVYNQLENVLIKEIDHCKKQEKSTLAVTSSSMELSL